MRSHDPFDDRFFKRFFTGIFGLACLSQLVFMAAVIVALVLLWRNFA